MHVCTHRENLMLRDDEDAAEVKLIDFGTGD